MDPMGIAGWLDSWPRIDGFNVKETVSVHLLPIFIMGMGISILDISGFMMPPWGLRGMVMYHKKTARVTKDPLLTHPLVYSNWDLKVLVRIYWGEKKTTFTTTGAPYRRTSHPMIRYCDRSKLLTFIGNGKPGVDGCSHLSHAKKNGFSWYRLFNRDPYNGLL